MKFLVTATKRKQGHGGIMESTDTHTFTHQSDKVTRADKIFARPKFGYYFVYMELSISTFHFTSRSIYPFGSITHVFRSSNRSVLIPVGVGTGGLGTTGLSGDDNLINRKNRPGSLGGELDSPLLGYEEIENTLLHGINGTGVVVVLQTC